MRPRLFAAENNSHEAKPTTDRAASMRPRLFAAENMRPMRCARRLRMLQ